MTANNSDIPPGVRLLTDGGTPRRTGEKHLDVRAKDVVTREVDGEDVEMLRVPISSTRTDREGDRFTKEALDGMADQIREEQPLMFQNHGLAGSWMDAIPYDQAETIGTHMDAEVVQEDDGEHVLHSFVNPDGTHPEGERMLKQVRDEKQAVKFSVGFKILNSDPIEDDAGNEIGTEFTRTDLMEDSKVGIPANRDATVTHEVGAKDSVTDLPGYRNHPMMLMLRSLAGGQPSDGTVAAKGYTPEGDPADLRAEVADLRAAVEELREDDGDDEDDDDDDEDDDEDDEEEDSATPDGTDGADPSEVEAIRAEIADLRESIKERGAGRSKDPSTEPEDPDLTNDGEPDADKEDEPETSGRDPSGWLTEE